jgi:hypothetical protein
MLNGVGARIDGFLEGINAGLEVLGDRAAGTR